MWLHYCDFIIQIVVKKKNKSIFSSIASDFILNLINKIT